jgi:hypothetical protein
MPEHTVESIVNMMAVIEADMMYNRYGFYGALKQVGMVEQFHKSTLQSETLKTFESKFWERVREFIEIKHPDFMGKSENRSFPNSFDDIGLEDIEL